MVEWGGWPTLVNPEFEPCKLCESLALLVMDGTGRNGWNTQSLENLEIIYLTSLVSPWSSYPHIHHDNPKKTHVRKQLFVDRLMQALLRATASIADAAKRGRLDKVWISPEGSPGHRGHLNHFAAFGNTCLCWFQPKVSLLTLEQASKMLQFSKKTDSRIQPLIRIWFDSMEMWWLSQHEALHLLAVFRDSPLRLDAVAHHAALGPLARKRWREAFQLAERMEQDISVEQTETGEVQRWKKQPNWLLEIYVMWMK